MDELLLTKKKAAGKRAQKRANVKLSVCDAGFSQVSLMLFYAPLGKPT